MLKLLDRIMAFLGSFGVVCVLLIWTLALTYLGTIAQVDQGLYDVQKRFFDSMLIWFGPVPAPGGYLTMILLASALVIGGLVRLRKSWRLAGVFVAHVGIGMLLVAGWVKQHFSSDGQLTLYETEQGAEFKSYHNWEIAIARAAGQGQPSVEFLIDEDGFVDLDPGASRTFTRPDIPFDLTVTRFFPHCEPQPEQAPRKSQDGPVVNGFYLRKFPKLSQTEANVAGAYISIQHRDSGHVQDQILWGYEIYMHLLKPGQARELPPLHVHSAGEDWGVTLRKTRESIPFQIHLDKFTRELHPGTSMPKVFLSDVTMTRDDVSRQLKITMNEPLRHAGYTLFQSGWGPQNAPAGRPLYSTFAVVRNPSDQWPLYSCIVIGAGLLLHFILKLVNYIMAQQRRLAS